jgi:hypothetical protein
MSNSYEPQDCILDLFAFIYILNQAGLTVNSGLKAAPLSSKQKVP